MPRDTVLTADRCVLRIDDSPHPFEEANRAAIAENWEREISEKPALFDGMVVLLSEASHRHGSFDAVCHPVRFSTFLYWRRQRPVPGAQHIYAHALLVTRDKALIAIRMGEHTANPGQIYFASGSFEPREFAAGRADIDGNMAREVAEETGLDLKAAAAEPGYHVLARENGIVIARRYFLDEDAEAIAARVARHVSIDPDPEIDGPVVIRADERLPEDLAPQMPALVDWHFANGKRR